MCVLSAPLGRLVRDYDKYGPMQMQMLYEHTFSQIVIVLMGKEVMIGFGEHEHGHDIFTRTFCAAQRRIISDHLFISFKMHKVYNLSRAAQIKSFSISFASMWIADFTIRFNSIWMMIELQH